MNYSVSITLTKLHAVLSFISEFLHFTRKWRANYLDVSATVYMTDQIATVLHYFARRSIQNLSLKCTVVKNFNFENPRWRKVAILKI